jgi:PD-(D/E)XK nuclease superfamily
MHSRMIGWLLVPTNRHGFGRRFLSAFLDHLWPDEALLRSGSVFVDLEMTGAGPDDTGQPREARADVVLRGETLTVVLENKLDAGEGADQCERLYWAWASESGDTRWVFLTPTGRSPVTTTSDAAKAAWRSMSYDDLRGIISKAVSDGQGDASIGRATATQYLWTLTGAPSR